MTRTGLLMQVVAFVTVCSVIFALAGASIPVQHTPVGIEENPHLIEGGAGEPQEIGFTDWVFSTGGCLLLGVFLAGDACLDSAQGFGDLFGFDTLSNVGVTFVTGANALAGALLGFLTFNVPGAPTWFRVLISAPLNVGLGYIIIAVARGI